MTAEENGTPTTFELVITRTLDAPRDLVWKAFTEPEHLEQWFCPDGMTVMFAETDLRVGGSWRSGMKSPDGDEYIHGGTYREIDPPSTLVFTQAWETDSAEPAPETTVNVTFREINDQTEVTFQHTGLPTQESREQHEHGWNECFVNLAAHLSKSVKMS